MSIEDPYPSRQSPDPAMLPRVDPVIYSVGAPREGLTAAQADFYQENGYIFLPGFFKPWEVGVLNSELDRLLRSDRIARAEEAIREPGNDMVRSIFNVHRLSEVFGNLCSDKRIFDLVRHLVGGEMYIHQSRINLKPGFSGAEFYWHSDFETWHVEDGMPRMRAVTVSLSLTENNEFNGPLMLVPGSHRTFISCVGETPRDHYKSSLRRQECGVPDTESLTRLVEKGGIVAPTGPAGSLTVFDCNTMHGSNSNISPYPRSNVFVVYNSLENALQEPFCGLAPRPEFVACRRDAMHVRPSTPGHPTTASLEPT